MKKRVVIPTLLIGALLTGGFALAGPYGYGPGNCDGKGYGRGQGLSAEEHQERMEYKLEMMGEILDLNEDQEEQIEALLQKQWASRQDNREKRQEDREELREMLTGDDFNETEFRALAMKKAEQKVDMMVEHAKLKQQIYALLTLEQQEKADKLMEMRGKHGRRHGGHGFGF